MSAFFVNKETIDAAVTFVARMSESPATDADLSEAGKRFWTMNMNAIKARYGHHPDLSEMIDPEAVAAYTFTRRPEPSKALFKALHCFLYQCCEGDIPETDPLYAELDAMATVLDKAKWNESPEYDAAPWGFWEPVAA